MGLILPEVKHASCGQPVRVCHITEGTETRRVIACIRCNTFITDPREMAPRGRGLPVYASDEARRVTEALDVIDKDQKAWDL